MNLSGHVRFEVRDARGKLRARGHGPNLVTLAGKVQAAAVLQTNSGGSPATTQFIRYLGFGDSATAADEAQVALQGTELFLPRPALTVARLDNVVTYTIAYTNAGGTVTVRELGLFTATPAGVMVARFLPNEFPFANSDVLGLTWSLEIG